MSQSPHNLSAETTSFVGRAAELARLAELFDGGARLVTITGAAGMGKSRLAARYAWGAAESGRWPGGIWRVDLTQAADAEAVTTALSRALGAPAETLADAIAARRECLVILEHVEHLLDHVRPLAEQLAIQGHVLLTTRERLGLTHEWCLTLGPLGLAPGDDGQSEAIRLLFDRGRALGFDPVRTCSKACQRCERLPRLARALDGRPLALELAARRLALMTPCQILDRIEQHDVRRFELLGSSTDPTLLRDAVARSWEALPQAERAMLCQLAIFGGAFDLDAAESVVRLPEPSLGLLDVLDALARKSLVQVMPTRGTWGNPLELYETERAYGRARLAAEPGLLTAAAERHAAWALRRFSQQAASGAGSDVPTLDARSELLTAIEWSLHPELLSADNVVRAFEMLALLAPVLGSRAALERAVPLLEAALAHAHLVSAGLATRARTTLSEALYLHGRGGEAFALLERGLVGLEDTDDPLLEALLMRSLGASHFYGRADVSIADLERACRALEPSVHAAEALDATMRLARAHENEGHIEEAIALYQQALERARATGERRRAALVLLNLGALQAHLGFDAGANYRVALAWSRELADPLLESVTLVNLGIAAFERRDDQAARAFFDEAAAVEAGLGVGRLSAITRGHQALLCHLRGELDEARALYREALAAWKHVWPDPLTWSLFTLGLAVLSAQTGDVVEAQRRLGELALVHEREPGPEPATSTLIRLAELGVGAAAANDGGATLETARELARPALGALARRPRGGSVALRVALRLLGIEPSAQPTAVLAIARGGHRFVTPDGRAIELGRRGPARRVLAELAARRVDGEARSVGVEELFEVAWPGEKIQAPYRANRVYVVIADLRKLGLEGMLLNDGEGYLLDPATPVVVIDA